MASPITASILVGLLMVAKAEGGAVTREIGGKTADAVFTEARVAELANAACVGDRDRMHRAVQAGADVNFRGLEGVTPLFWALACENLDGFRGLVELGANINQQDNGRSTAVYYAATYNNPAFLRFLLEHGGDPNIVNDSGYMPLEAALSQMRETGNRTNFETLLSAGARLETQNERGDTIVDLAVMRGEFALVHQLLARGYRGDRQKLLSYANVRQVDRNSPEAHWRDLVIEQLRP